MREDSGSSYSGVLPSRKVTTGFPDAGAGRSSRKRQTPLRSRAAFEERRSRQRDFNDDASRPPDFQAGWAISSKFPHCEQRKSWAAEGVTEEQPMQRKQNVD